MWRRGTDRQTEGVLLSVHREITWLEKSSRVYILYLFALDCLRICVSYIWMWFLCALTHVCLYVLRRYDTAGAKLSKPKPDSLYSVLCDILPFIFPLWLKSKSLLSLAQLSPLDISLARKTKRIVSRCFLGTRSDIKLFCIGFLFFQQILYCEMKNLILWFWNDAYCVLLSHHAECYMVVSKLI